MRLPALSVALLLLLASSCSRSPTVEREPPTEPQPAISGATAVAGGEARWSGTTSTASPGR
jgi:hypothetical protein